MYFNSIRNPFDYYASLYNYGCDGHGGVMESLQAANFGDFYDNSSNGFLAWVDFVLNPKNALICSSAYGKTCGAAVGFLTYRFLRLSFASPRRKLLKLQSPDDAFELYDRYNICTVTLRQERLNSDLENLFHGELHDFVVDDAVEYLPSTGKINVSSSKVATGDALAGSALASRVLERDKMIFGKFYTEFT